MITIYGETFDRNEIKRIALQTLGTMCYSGLKAKVQKVLYAIQNEEHSELVAHPNYREPVINE
jgi:hypothetical protein